MISGNNSWIAVRDKWCYLPRLSKGWKWSERDQPDFSQICGIMSAYDVMTQYVEAVMLFNSLNMCDEVTSWRERTVT